MGCATQGGRDTALDTLCCRNRLRVMGGSDLSTSSNSRSAIVWSFEPDCVPHIWRHSDPRSTQGRPRSNQVDTGSTRLDPWSTWVDLGLTCVDPETTQADSRSTWVYPWSTLGRPGSTYGRPGSTWVDPGSTQVDPGSTLGRPRSTQARPKVRMLKVSKYYTQCAVGSQAVGRTKPTMLEH